MLSCNGEFVFGELRKDNKLYDTLTSVFDYGDWSLVLRSVHGRTDRFHTKTRFTDRQLNKLYTS